MKKRNYLILLFFLLFLSSFNTPEWADPVHITKPKETGELHGKASKWLTYEVKNIEGELISLTIFDHPDNLNHPNKWFIEKNPDIPFYYFSPAILFDSKELLHEGEKLHLKYRLLISPGKTVQSQLLEDWNNFKK